MLEQGAVRRQDPQPLPPRSQGGYFDPEGPDEQSHRENPPATVPLENLQS